MGKRFRSQYMNDTVFTDNGEVVLAMFKDYSFETDDPEVAKKLKAQGYQEFDVIGLDDTLELQDGTNITVRQIIEKSPEIGKEILGLPKALAKKAISIIPGLSGDSGDQDPPDSGSGDIFICEWCGTDEYKSQPALNGHKGHCPKKPPKDKDE